MPRVKSILASVPGLSTVAKRARLHVDQYRFESSSAYWEQRYSEGGTSGAGSYGRLAEAKAEILNRFVKDQQVATVLELGCGDGNQLALADYPSYVGVDVASTSIATCRARFGSDATKRFFVSGSEELPICELGLSLDVIYHLVEDETYHKYMNDLVACSSRFVILYSSDSKVFVPPVPLPPHIRHRPIQEWMGTRKDWRLKQTLKNPYPFRPDDQSNTSFADFYIFERVSVTDFS